MSDGGWFLLVAFSALALASMAVRSIPKHRGAELGVYLLTIGLAAATGCGVAAAIDASWVVVGAVAGVAAVEVGPAIARAVRGIIHRRGGKL